MASARCGQAAALLLPGMRITLAQWGLWNTTLCSAGCAQQACPWLGGGGMDGKEGSRRGKEGIEGGQ